MGRTGINWTSEFPRFVADVTGDGRADLVGCGIDGVWVSRNDGQGNFQPPELALTDLGFGQGWRVERHVRALGQFGGAQRPVVIAQRTVSAAATPARALGGGIISPLNSRFAGADMAGFGDEGLWVALSHGDGKFDSANLALANLGANQEWQVGRHLRGFADLNGDGLSDIVGFGDAGVWTALCTGQPAADAATIGEAKFVLANFGYNQGWRIDQHPRVLTDLTGDGRADIVAFGNDGLWTSIGGGDGGFAAAKLVISNFGYNQGWRVDVHERLMGDLTGDGKADFVGFGNDGVWTALGDGSGGFAAAKLVLVGFCASQGWRSDRHLRFVADLTGNKHADLIGFGDDGVWTALGDGNGGFAAARFVIQNLGVNQGWTVANHPRFLADVNGDGLPDIVAFGDAGVWAALNKGDGTFGDPQFVLADFGLKSGQTGIKHIFVLMMENRSFDHFLGFSGITGIDTATGQPTSAEVLTGNETNTNTEIAPFLTYKVDQSAGDTTIGHHDVLHQFSDVTVQLCGTEHLQLNGGRYPAVNNSGFVTDYVAFADSTNPGEPMRCFNPKYVPILTQLAKEFILCDHWYSAMAGPTEPNRMFAHAATSGVWDDSPSGSDQLKDEVFDSKGIHFDTGTLYDRLRGAKPPVSFRIYSGDGVPNVVLLTGIGLSDVELFENFEKDVMDPSYDAAYTFIEPYYGTIDQYLSRLGSSFKDEAEKLAIDALKALLKEVGLLAAPQPINSQHPGNSVYEGESLIKKVYEIIRSSPHWNDSMLILAWDEHGGFYDHMRPPAAAPTGSKGQAHGFIFDQYGPRVPAVVISPLCPQGMIEHRRLEHSAILATVEQVFGLQPMTVRDSSIIGVQNLASLQAPRQNTPVTLTPDSQRSRAPLGQAGSNEALTAVSTSTLLNSIKDPWLTSAIFIIAKGHMETAATPEESTRIKVRVQGLQTVGDLVQYLNDAIPPVRRKQVASRQMRVAARSTRVTPAQPSAGPAAAPR
jgi:phospholipase C